MVRRWRLLLAAVFIAIPAADPLMAQTVIVRDASAGSTVEVVLNTASVGSATAGPGGVATVSLDRSSAGSRPEIYVSLSVDVCDGRYRVLLVEALVQSPPSAAGCIRREIAGLFVVRPVSTLIVDVRGSAPTVLLRQGPVNLARLGMLFTAPTGLALFGDASLGTFGDPQGMACGDLFDCSGGDLWRGLAVGVTYWITPHVAAEAAYLRPGRVRFTGASTPAPSLFAGVEQQFDFETTLDARLLTLVAKVGGPTGRARVYGQGGISRHEALVRTTQRVEDLALGSGQDVAAILPGGTQTYEIKTTGWSWVLGGGVEVWTSPLLAVYVEGGLAPLKGAATGEGEGTLDDRLTFLRVGARFRIGL
ncbi:MAG: hypothetical protein HY657_10665 [Acidobacteria bacterium]|nr:hypothetical protein [Acidobacteriota bacterium]